MHQSVHDRRVAPITFYSPLLEELNVLLAKQCTKALKSNYAAEGGKASLQSPTYVHSGLLTISYRRGG